MAVVSQLGSGERKTEREGEGEGGGGERESAGERKVLSRSSDMVCFFLSFARLSPSVSLLLHASVTQRKKMTKKEKKAGPEASLVNVS